ncbi:hypothetical protein F8388_026158 [Cannabis sativa]|uniref:Uncharacterized protein n=1 Tax=Cannabis sativa TaxID=3483 RepID=A0A7J6GG03_CANSA|nr:hypothetical protein F8388_026158 [Cannabis sativa]KAF4381782.1 hypothetical protein G4B88_002932 [Cannabis sativa]
MNTQPISVKLREERERDFEAEIEIDKGDEGFETVGFVVAFEIKSELGVADHDMMITNKPQTASEDTEPHSSPNMKALARTSGLIGGLDPNTALAMVITPGFWLPNPAKAKAGVFPILNWK